MSEATQDQGRFEKVRKSRARCDLDKMVVHTSGRICHHCHKLLCSREEHAKEGVQTLEFRGKQGKGFLARFGVLFPKGASLPGFELRPYGIHCPDHTHRLQSWFPLVLAGLLVLIGGLLIPLLAVDVSNNDAAVRWTSVAVSLVGTILLFAGTALHYLKYVSKVRYLDAGCVPLVPDNIDVIVRENVTADFVIGPLNADRVGSFVSNVRGSGALEVVADFGPKERKTSRDFGAEANAKWDLGYLVIDDLSTVALEGNSEKLVYHMVVDPKRFREEIEYGTFGRFSILSLPYEVDVGKGLYKVEYWEGKGEAADVTDRPPEYPVMIFPWIGESTGRDLNLIIGVLDPHWLAKETELDLKMVITDLTIDVPPELRAFRCDPGSGKYLPDKNQVVWQNLEMSGGWHERLQVTFQDKILETLRRLPGNQGAITGEYHLEVTGGRYGALSMFGVESHHLFTPNGYPRASSQVRFLTRTVLSGRFRIDPACLACAEAFVPPPQTVEREDRIPDHRVVAALTKMLAESGVYIAEVNEKPPVLDTKSANVKHRSWEITARRYGGACRLFGVDVHVILSGLERYGSGITPEGGRCRVEIGVRALAHDQYTKDIATGLLEDVKAKVENSLS